MAEVGLIPFASTYSVFATRRAYDFLCLDIAEPNLNVNVVGGAARPDHRVRAQPPGHRGHRDPPRLPEPDHRRPLRLGRHRAGRPAARRPRRAHLPAAAPRRGAHRARRVRLPLRARQGRGAAHRPRRRAHLHRPDDHAGAAGRGPARSRPRRRRGRCTCRRSNRWTARRSCARPRTDRLVVTLENHTVIGGLSEAVAVDARLRRGRHADRARSRCPTSSSPPAPCPPCTTATGCPPTPSSPRSRPSWTRTPRACRRRRRPRLTTDRPSKENPMSSLGQDRRRHRRRLRPRHRPRHRPRPRRRRLEHRDPRPRRGRRQGRRQRGRRAPRRPGRRRRLRRHRRRVRRGRAGRRRRRRPAGRRAGQQRRHHLTDPVPRGHRARSGSACSPSTCAAPTTSPASSRPAWSSAASAGSCSCRRSPPSAAAASSAASPTPRPRPAQLGFARALARELGPNGVTVNSVAPGLIDTDITAGKLVGEKEKQVLAGVPVGRKGRVADVADLITYLCREESGYITGATYDVNGGAHIH